VSIETVALLAFRKRYLPWARVLFATAALASGLMLTPRGPPWALAAAGAFLALGLFTALRAKEQGGLFGLLVLFADLAFFLVLVSSGTGRCILRGRFCWLWC